MFGDYKQKGEKSPLFSINTSAKHIKQMEEFLEGLRTFECPPPDPSEIISGGAPACTWLPRTKEWNDNISKSKIGFKHNEKTKQKIRNSLLGVKHTEERKRNNSIGSCKYQYIITSPDGEVFYETNMKAFCMNRDIDAGAMTKVAQGKFRQHKGWTIIREKASNSK